MRSSLLISFSFLPLLFLEYSMGEDWNYNNLGPDIWDDMYATCVGPVQSPINIQTPCTVYKNFSAFNLLSSYNLNQTLELYNNGHGISATLVNQTNNPPRLQGGGLNGTYEFVNFHLHWGENYGSGSEHEVNGQKYAGEIHFVHANTETDALAVLGFFITARKNSTSHSRSSRRRRRRETMNDSQSLLQEEWGKYFAAASELTEIENATFIELNLMDLIGDRLANFWRYSGSLTTPPCTEGVTWTVFTEPIELDDDNLNLFRQKLFEMNFRPPQPLRGRMVYRNFLVDMFASTAEGDCCSKSLGENRSNVKSISFSFVLSLLFAHIFFLL